MDKIFYNGIILTMEQEERVEAVLISNDIISDIGDKDKLLKKSPHAQVIDLQGKTLMPAFIDAHSHFSGYANSLLQVPLEETISFKEICDNIRMYIEQHHIPEGQWIIAKGYDHNSLQEKAHPTKEILDSVAPNNPVVIQHKSGHFGVFNTKALECLGITIDTKPPKGGVIQTINGKLTGLLEETAYMEYLRQVPMPELKDLLQAYRDIQKRYASYGITTVQEGMLVKEIIPLYEHMMKANMLDIDIVAYADINAADEILNLLPNNVKQYNNHVKIGGYKMFLDGSPQGRTAWMLTPYKNGEPDYCGYGTMSSEDVLAAVKKANENNVQILAHCNGDAAAKQFIDAVKQVEAASKDIKTQRPVIVHAQLININQLDDVKAMNMIPSFFIAHVYHWGDIHIQNFGFERAKDISPAKAALDRGILFTFHQDSPVIDPNMLETVWCAVKRQTKDGVILGDAQRIEVLEALKAVTINSAYQYFEEDKKGSIQVGKFADLIILNQNPLEVDIDQIKDIQILETIKNGKTIFKKEA